MAAVAGIHLGAGLQKIVKHFHGTESGGSVQRGNLRTIDRPISLNDKWRRGGGVYVDVLLQQKLHGCRG